MDIRRLKEELIAEIQEYRKKNPSIDLGNIAKRMNRPESALKSIFEIENKYPPRPDTILALMGIITEMREVSEVIALCQGNIKEYLQDSFPMYMGPKVQSPVSSKIEFSITDKESFIIVCLCGATTGSSRQEVRTILGTLGEQRLDELIQVEALKEEDNGSIYTIDKNIWISPKTIRQYAGEFLQFFKSEDMSKDCSNLLYFIVESISEDYRKEVVKILFEAFAKIRKGLKDPQNSGHTKFFTMVLSDTLTLPEGGQSL